MRTGHLEKFHVWRGAVPGHRQACTRIHVSGAQDFLSKPIAKEDAKCVYHASGINIYRSIPDHGSIRGKIAHPPECRRPSTSIVSPSHSGKT